MQLLSRIPTRFDERKTAAAASFLLREAGGRMPYLRLIKLLYLVDRESWDRFGRSISGDDYVSMKHGPVLSTTYDLVRREPGTDEGPWASTIERAGDFEVRLRGDPDLACLSDAEVDLLKEAHELCRTLDRWKLRDLTHSFKEWEDPGESSNPIWPEHILEALEKTAEEIDTIRQEAAEREHFDRLFGR